VPPVAATACAVYEVPTVAVAGLSALVVIEGADEAAATTVTTAVAVFEESSVLVAATWKVPVVLGAV